MRRWFLQDSTPLVQGISLFSKDVPLTVALVLSLGWPAAVGLGRALYTLLLVGTTLVALGSLAAVDGFSPVGAIMTIRNSVLVYWLAYRVGPQLKGKSDVAVLCHTAGLLAVVNAGVGLAQFYLPTSHWLNAMTSEQIVAEGALGRVRACGTFSYISGMSNICVFSGWASAILISRGPTRPLGYIYLLAGVTCASVTMSRSGAMHWVVLMVLILASRPVGRFAGVALGVAAVIGFIGYGDRLNDDSDDVNVYTAVLRRHNATSDTLLGRAFGTYTDELPAAVFELPFGSGIGQGQTGGRAVASETGLVTQYAYEGEPSRVVAEIGLVGFLGVYAIRVGLPALLLWRRELDAGRATGPALQSVWWPTVWFLVIGINMTVVFDHVQATFQAVALAGLLGAARLNRGSR